ncbi:CTNS protein [Geosmithia morbida]|uniref:CTNS protein n=1 Tax=Geosmithia morbida TaxID=1094350 RepID=A0A9P4YWV6_9HYPO|nr:CTNS protein [Geosmithia morbida]KAF4123191.1 CTNS protein [Geosmithia morbida]
MAPPTAILNLDVEAISGICGSVSIACWVVVFSPQIIQNFQRGSADALSVQFIIVWLLGDVFNILGAVLQGVLPTMIILAIYYTIADIVLLGQCFYYRGFTWRDEPTPAPKPVSDAEDGPDERSRLLDSSGAGERRNSDWSALSPAVPHIADTPPPAAPGTLQTILLNSLAVVMVIAAGVLGWFLGRKATAAGGGHDDAPSNDDAPEFNALGQFFGWLCAVSYIASRLPQLILNWRRKTTDGLSMLFFLFACLGNTTYVLSILAYEPKCGDRRCTSAEAGAIYGRYILVNLSWIAGAFVTLLLDLGVFAQYFFYDNQETESAPRRRVNGHGGAENRDDRRPLLSTEDGATTA